MTINVKFDVYVKRDLGTLFKSNEVDLDGLEAYVNLDLGRVDSMKVNYLIGNKRLTDDVIIKDDERRLILIPFKSEVRIAERKIQFEIQANMKNGDVKVSQTYVYDVEMGIGEGTQVGIGGSGDGHTHNNLSTLHKITEAKIKAWDAKSDFSGSYNDLTNKPTIPTVDVTKAYVDSEVSKKADKTHSHSEYATPSYVQEKIAEASLSGGDVDLSAYATKAELNTKADKSHTHNELHSHSNKTVLDEITSSKVNEWNNKSTFNGDYNSLTNKPVIPNTEGLASESYVQAKIAEASLSGGEVDLSAYATRDYVGQEISKIELTPGPQGERGLQGEQGPKGDKGEQGPQGEPGVTSWNALEDKPTNLATQTYVNQKIADAQLGTGNSTVSIFKGLKATFYGDSLTEKNGHYTKGYHQWISELVGLESYQNFGVSGYTLKQIATKVQGTAATGDVIFIMGGVNDQTFHKPLGTIDDSTDKDTTYGALKLLCSTLKAKYPTKLIIFITPHYQVKYPSNLGITSYEVSKAVKDVCYLYAIPVYDNFQNSGIYPQNATNKSTYTTDGTHWNDLGHEKVGRNIAKYMLNTFAHLTGVIIKDDEDTGGDDNPGGDDNEDSGGEFDGTYIGKRITFTTSRATSQFHLTPVISANNIKSGDVLSVSLKLSNTSNIKANTSANGGGVFGATSSDVSDGLFSGQLGNGNFTHSTTDGITTITSTAMTLGSVSTSYLKVAILVSTDNIPASGVIEELKITVNDVEQEIINLGGFFAVEVCEFEDFEDTGGDDNPGDDNEDTGGEFDGTYIGKTLTITGVRFNGYHHLTPVIDGRGISAGDVIGCSMKISNATNIKTEGDLSGGGSIFTANSSDLNNGLFSAEVSGGRRFTYTTSDGVTTITCSDTTITSTGPYFKLPIMFGYTSIPASGVIEELKVTVNGVEQEILNLGGFFAEETCTFK